MKETTLLKSKYFKEAIFLMLQMLMFYIFPLFAGPTDAMGMVFLIILATFVLSILLGSLSAKAIKLLYPPVIAILFIPSVFIYYNSTALTHSSWYLVISFVGLGIGMLIRCFAMKIKRNK